MKTGSRRTKPEALAPWQNRVLILISGAALIMTALNMRLDGKNQLVQEEVTKNQQYINQTIRISRLNGEMIQALANVSAQTGDASIRELLKAHGITYTVQSKPETKK